MSIQNNTAVDVYQNFILPTALDSDFSSEDLADDMDGLQLTMQRVKIPGGGNLQFEIRSDDPDNPDYERKLVGVILYHHLANAYWPEGSEYDDNVPPFCQSFDGKQGYGEPGGVCAACAFNQFGSTANGSGKAVLEYAVDRKRLGAKTLFATHYHELTDMEQTLPGVKNFNIAVKKRQGDMIFLRKIVPGAADDSYGVEVAKMAGLPERVIVRARTLLKELESGAPQRAPGPNGPADEQVSMLDLHTDALREAFERVNVETLTPIEAMNVLYRLKQML